MSTRTRRRTATVTLAAIAVAVAVILTILVPAIAERTTSSWGDLYAAGFGLGLLVAWALGTLTFSSRRERT
jgi:ABC-type dipeptide/oligopeptide/nickel transport system permease component